MLHWAMKQIIETSIKVSQHANLLHFHSHVEKFLQILNTTYSVLSFHVRQQRDHFFYLSENVIVH